MNDTHEVMRTKDAAKYLQVAEQTLEGWRMKKKGPPYVKIGASVRYRKSDLDAWMDEHQRTHE